MSPLHSINICPICGGGLCGIRICGIATNDDESSEQQPTPHGLVVCDECEAIWLEPDLSTAHQYADVEDARCPICSRRLWSDASRWADQSDLVTLGWEFAVDPELDAPELGD